MHQSVLRFIADAVQRYQLAERRVLEVGSRIINGSPRALFNGPYWGVDILAGPGVDEVCNAHALTNGQRPAFAPVEVIICTEMLEHDDAPWRSLTEMREIIQPGGMLLLTARGYDEHGYYQVHDRCYDSAGTYEVGDYWRFSVSGMRAMLEQTGWDVVMCGPDADVDRPGVFAIATAS
jgi:hypothetical protein